MKAAHQSWIAMRNDLQTLSILNQMTGSGYKYEDLEHLPLDLLAYVDALSQLKNWGYGGG